MLEPAKYDNNKEYDLVAQVNLLMIDDAVSGISLLLCSLSDNYSD
ncbi:MAG: hypothetical protein WBI82_14570 [Sphaerochaeta sp.]